MSRQAYDQEYRLTQLAVSTVYLLLIAVLTIASASANEVVGERASSSLHQVVGGRDGAAAAITVTDQYPELARDGLRQSPGRALESSASSSERPALARSLSYDFWIYDADVLLFGDDDDDGFFHGIDLLFDADTLWPSATVYAVVYLSLQGGPWNEYAITEDFFISGATGDDEYVVVTELESGYPTGDYDLLIELYDARNGDFLADFGPESSPALGFLALEDFNRDAPFFDQPVAVSRSHGGGSAGFLTLILLAGAAAFRYLRAT